MKREKIPSQSIARICGSIILTIAIYAVLAGLVAFSPVKSINFAPFQETLPHDDGDNSATRLLWQGEQVSLNFTLTAAQHIASRLPIRYINSRYQPHISLPLSAIAKLPGIIPSFIGITNTAFASGDVYIFFLVDIPPPNPKA